MQNPKSDIWVPDTRPGSVSTFTESYTPAGGSQQSATYKAIPNHTIIGGILNKLSFSWGHAKATWYNKLAGKTVADKFDETDTAIQDLSVNMEGMKNQILRIASPAQIPFVAVGNAKSISVIKNDSIIEIHNIGFNENFSTATQPSVQIGGVNYAIWAKVDNSNPFSLFPDNAIGISHMILLDVTGNLLTFINMGIGYDGVNTYLMSDNFTNPNKKAGTSIPTIHLYNSQPK